MTTNSTFIRATLLGAAFAIFQPHLNSAEMASAFTYQGRLQDGGVPANGLYDFEFGLTDSPSNSVVYVTNPLFAVPVSNGVFTAALDFGTGYFNGDPRWIEVAVRSSGTGSNFTTLLPRTPLTATPYALFASSAATAVSATTAQSAGSVAWANVSGLPGDFADGLDNDTLYSAGAGLSLSPANQFAINFDGTGASNAAARSDHTHFGQSWLGASTNSGLDVRNTGIVGAGLVGRHGNGSGVSSTVSAGVLGDSQFSVGVAGFGIGHGVSGYATSTAGETYGVTGGTAAPAGFGVLGSASATYGPATGVSGTSQSTNGFGIKGIAAATSGLNVGVLGQTESKAGIGVKGVAMSTGGATYGGYFETYSGAGLYARSTYGNAARLEVTNASSGGSALKVEHRGNGHAGEFTVNNPNSTKDSVAAWNNGEGDAVSAYQGADGNAGYFFASGSGAGVYAHSSDGPGVDASSSSGNAVKAFHGGPAATVYANNTGAGAAVHGQGNSGRGVHAQSLTGSALYAKSSTGAAIELGGGAIKVTGAGLNTPTPAFIHEATGANIPDSDMYRTYLDHPICNNNPDAIIVVNYRGDPPGQRYVRNGPWSVRYAISVGKWYIYSLGEGIDGFIYPGDKFNVIVVVP